MINFHSVSYILILPVEPPAQIAIPAVLCGQDGYFVELQSRVFNDCQLKIYLHKKKNIYIKFCFFKRLMVFFDTACGASKQDQES